MYTKKHRDNMLDQYMGDNTHVDELDFSHIAFGNGGTPATETDIILQSEQFRKPILAKSRKSDSVDSLVILDIDEANDFPITEIGLFSKGTNDPNTGVLIARKVFTEPLRKNAGNKITILRKDIIKTDR